MSATLLSWRNLKRKRVNNIVRISRQEMEFLRKNGVKFGEEGIVSTTGHHKSWYMTESEENKFLMRKYRAVNFLKTKKNKNER